MVQKALLAESQCVSVVLAVAGKEPARRTNPLMKTREQVVEELIEHAKIISLGAEDWQLITNISNMGAYLRELDGDEDE